MAATPGVDQLRITVVSEEDDRERFYKFAPTTSVAEVVAAWIADEGTEDKWSVRRDSGTSLTGAEHLIDISEGRRVVGLYVKRRRMEEPADETVTLSLSLFGESGDIHELTVSLSQTVEEIHPAVRESFDIPQCRTFRLMREDGPLEYEIPLAEVGLPLTCPIVVELGYEVEVEDAWSGEVEKHFVYASESLFDLMETTPSHMKRVYLGTRLIDTSRCLASNLPANVRHLTTIRLVFEYQRFVTLHLNGKWKRHQVWPQERLEKVLPATSNECWRYDRKNVERGQTFHEIGLQDQATLLQDRPVLVKYSDGEGVVIWLPELSTIGHLREEVLKKEADADFCLKLGNRVLQLEECVPQMSDSDKAITVVRSENSFEVDLDGTEVKWISRTGNIRFSQFSRELLENGKLKWSDLADLEFRCDGCGRQIRRCEEEFQLLPADCCHVRSLRLSSYNPVEVKDRAAQGQSRSDHRSAMRNKTFGHRTDVQGGSSQTRVEGMDATTETCGGMGGRAVCTQHPPPSPPPSLRPFQLWNDTGEGRFQGQSTDVSLLLPSSPTAGQLTTAVALECGLRPEETEIVTLVSVSRGVRIVLAVEGEEYFFSTEDGSRRVELEDVKDRKNEYWTVDDTAPIVLPPGRRLCFNVLNR